MTTRTRHGASLQHSTMKHKWECKSWSDVIRIINGKNQKAVENPNGKYPIYGSGGIMSYADDYLCPENCTIIGRKGSINKPIFVTTKFWNVDTAFGLCTDKEFLTPRFLYYFCLHYDFMKHNKATTLPSLVKGDLLKIMMPVPPIEEQERIVAELDSLNGTIAKCRELLATLDSLAQSLFYDTFGDPNTLTKHTKVSFGAISINLDSKRRPVTKTDRISGIFPYYGASGIVDYVSEYIFDGDYLLISEDGANLISRTQPIAFLSNGKVWINNHAHVVNFDNPVTRIFAMYYLNLLDFSEKITGMAQPKLTQKALNEIMISWPPLALQEDFARKIEAIEAEKKKVEATMAEVQTLLDSRMDYWFN